MKLTDNDIKFLKSEKRIGVIFMIIILLFGLIFNAFYLLLSKKTDFTLLILADLAIISLALTIRYLMNRSYNKDIKRGERIIKKGIVMAKTEEKNYEAGSGKLYIPILGDLFPKIWGQKIKESKNYTLIINSIKYPVSEKIYNLIKIDDEVNMIYSEFSQILLEIENQ